MTPPRDLMAKRALLGQAVASHVGPHFAGREVAVLYALAAIGPAPVTTEALARAVGVAPSSVRRLVTSPLMADGGYVHEIEGGWWQIGARLIEVANRLGADL